MKLTVNDLDCLSLGSALLGSGGGGDSSYSCMMAKYQFELYGAVNLISVSDLHNDDYVIPVAIMGAPLINMERLINGKELENLIRIIEERLGGKPTVLMPGEIGGANAFAPLLIAAKLNLPILDADLIGRAFPELQMNSCSIKKRNMGPAIVGDCLGNAVIIETQDIKTLEKIARGVTVAMGSSAAIALHLMRGAEVADLVVQGSFSKALSLGRIIEQARTNGVNPITALIEASEAHFLGEGVLVDIQQTIRGGFLEGSVALLTPRGIIKIFYQNEYLLASIDDDFLATTPDILMLIEKTSGSPITSEGLKYGIQAALIAIPAPAIWQSDEGLALVGPHVFGFKVDYQSISTRCL